MATIADDRVFTAVHILLVTSEHCHFCGQAKEILARLNVEFPAPLLVDEVDITSAEGRSLAAEHGILFPPGIFIDGTFAGFGRPSERRLLKILGKHLLERVVTPVGIGR